MNDDTNAKKKELEVKEESFVEKKASKAKIITTIAICIALIVCSVALIIYFISKSFIATTFIDSVVTSINTSIDSYNDYSSFYEKLKNYPNTVSDISAKVSSNNKNLESLNGFDLNIKGYKAKDYLALETAINYDKKNLISLNSYIDESKMFIESKDFYDGLLKIYFENKDDQEKLDDIISFFKAISNIDDLKDLSKTEIKAYAEALKVADISRKFNGMTVNYKIDINANNVKKVNDKFDTVINENPIIREFVKFLEKYDSDEENKELTENTVTPMAINVETSYFSDVFSPMTISINVDMFSKEIKDFEIIYTETDEVIEGTRIESGKYKIGNDKEYTILEYSETRIAFLGYEYKEKISEIILEKKTDRIVGRLKEEGFTIDIEENESEGSVRFNIDDKDMGKFDGVLKYKFEEDKKEIGMDLSINTEIEGYKINFKITGTEKFGDNLFTKKDLSTYKNISDLSENEYEAIANKLMEKLMQFE